MNIFSWFTERMSDAFVQHPSFFVYLLFSMTLLIILSIDLYRMKNNQINRQVSARLEKDKDSDEAKAFRFTLIEKLFESQEDKIKTTLKRANILFTPKEFLTFMTIGTIAGFILGSVVYPFSVIWKSAFAFLSTNLAQDFLGRLLAGVVLGFLGSYFPYGWVKYLEKKRRKILETQIQDALLNIADALKSGHVINNAIKIVGEEMPYPMGDEFEQAYKEMEAGKTLREALYDLKHRVNIEDFTMAINAMEIQYEVGGELEPLLRKMVQVVQERQELKQEVKKTIANAKMTGTILMFAPVGFLALFITMSSDQYLIMIQSITGWIMIIAAAILYAIGVFIISLIIKNVTKEI